MKNAPCEVCIVNAMCRDECEWLVLYLRMNLPGSDPVTGNDLNWMYNTIASNYRKKVWKLVYDKDGYLIGADNAKPM